jgi:hypothetical protein
VVAPDGPERLRQQELPCRVIADPAGQLLGTLGQVSRWYRLGRLPGLLAVDAAGSVVWRHDGKGMADLPDLDAALKALGV